MKTLFEIKKENEIYILFVYGTEFLKSDNINDVILEQARICLL